MFEEGNRLKSIHGDDNVFDLSLGNPLLEPPSEFKNKLIEIIKNSQEGSHRYMPNAGFTDVRKKIAKNISNETNLMFSENETTKAFLLEQRIRATMDIGFLTLNWYQNFLLPSHPNCFYHKLLQSQINCSKLHLITSSIQYGGHVCFSNL